MSQTLKLNLKIKTEIAISKNHLDYPKPLEDFIILATDGMDKLLNTKGFQMTSFASAKELVNRAETLEKDQRLRSDDKAIIVVRVGKIM